MTQGTAGTAGRSIPVAEPLYRERPEEGRPVRRWPVMSALNGPTVPPVNQTPEIFAVKTKERIVQAALELFNQHGERAITTNHIAAHLKISPGNLYYHYRNKADIIARIFDQYEQTVAHLFVLPQDRPITLQDRKEVVDKLLNLIWEYRFMHRDLAGMLASDEQLKTRYQAFAQSAIDSTEALYRKMCESGFMQIPEAALRPLALNVWLLMTGWSTYLRTACGISEEAFTRDRLSEVIYQLTYMEMPYLTEATREETEKLLASFRPDNA